jgi:predicted Zn-dependent protease
MNQDKTFLVTSLPPVLSKPCHLLYTPPKIHADLRELTQTKPKEALNQLLVAKTPELANLKAYTLLKLKKLRAAQKVITENYSLYPDSLSVKINYADLCLRNSPYANKQNLIRTFHN